MSVDVRDVNKYIHSISHNIHETTLLEILAMGRKAAVMHINKNVACQFTDLP